MIVRHFWVRGLPVPSLLEEEPHGEIPGTMGSGPGLRRNGRVGARSLQPGSYTHIGPDDSAAGHYEYRDPSADDGRYGRRDRCSADGGADVTRDDGTDHRRDDGADNRRYD